MHVISFSTAVVLVATLAAPVAEAGLVQERASNLCNQKNYGASGAPWQHNSAPGSFCGKNKPSNSGQWATLPYWDGGDVVKCSGSSRKGLKVCNGGNPTTSLPNNCNPPHNFPSGWGGVNVGTKGGSYQVVCKPSAQAQCSWAQWWNCLLPQAWRQTCTVTYTPPAGTKPSSSAAASSSKAVSSAAASSVVPSSAAASSAVSSAAGSASSAAGSASSAAASSAASSAADAGSTAAPSSADPTSVTPSSTSSAAPVQTTITGVDPTTYPVCQSSYQVTYQNYTLVAPNGYWMGQTVGSATQDASYMTYTLALTVGDCLAACDQIEGCVFVNTYYDFNEEEDYLPKHAPGVLTCSMYSTCVGTEKNDNFGGQDDPNQILNSNGYCKSGACS